MLNSRILIIDAHSVYIKKTEGFLKGLTFHNIELAATGKIGLEKIRNESVDLIILSALLPDMPSTDICQKAKLIVPGVMIIVQIGLFYTDEDIAGLIKSGADKVLDRKEKDLQPLQQAIEDLMATPQ